MKKHKLVALTLATLALSLWLGVAMAQQAAPSPAAPVAEAGKAADAVKPDNATKPAEGDAKKSKLAAAIEKAPRGTEPGMIDETKPTGFLGIPGAPNVNPILAFCWAVWVGWIFSTVGAFGGVMAGVGHMSVFGFGAYAGAFKKTAPDLGKVITDSIKASNQFLVGTSAAISSFNYLKMKRLVLPLAISLGLGSLIGAWAAQELSAGKLDFKSYQGYFGLFVLVLGCWLFYETTPAGQAKKKTAKEAAKAFEDSVKKQKCGDSMEGCDIGLKIQKFNFSTCAFTFYGVPFKFNPLLPFLGGVVISAAAAFLGVGGGFLLVPFLTSVTQLPMYLAAGTSALAVLVGMVTSIITLMSKGTPIEWSLIGLELVGITLGSIVGPMTSKYLSDSLMKRIFIVLSLYIGTGYLLAGFFGIKIPGV
ncbi:MAG: sulfite exporter TauE/SafE family protein [Humidesulfovibrio sp.]|uniref:sulfite exporter TauE/SafE family protein n=1 Tax=Humidesulfovibrio sp. TaxID=2910988 RepID=UPI0027323DA1|nr:sulfite exporter TauE/SafE family protein [Humidesulfovibrio sp.]MDP2848461.1 sulfite exporter TauE/SafE family protein [Humidesulfovibrio sp.]